MIYTLHVSSLTPHSHGISTISHGILMEQIKTCKLCIHEKPGYPYITCCAKCSLDLGKGLQKIDLNK